MKFLLILAILTVGGGASWADQSNELCVRALTASHLLPSTQTLLGEKYTTGNLKLSSTGSFAAETELETRFLSELAKPGLRAVLADHELTRLFLDHLIRLGFIKKNVEDPFYVQFKLLAANEPVWLDRKNPDPVIARYLKAKKLLKKARVKGEVPKLEPVSEAERADTLYWLTLKALATIPDDDRSSRDAIHAAFIELARLKGRNSLSLQSAETVLSSLKAYAVYIPRQIKVWNPALAIVKEIPGGGILTAGIEVALDFYDRFRDRHLHTQAFEVGSEPKFHEMIKGTLRIGFHNGDPYQYAHKARAFFDKYVNQHAPLFSPAFVSDLAEAYPEIEILLKNNKRFTILNGISGNYINDGPFGPGTFDTYKVVGRAASAIALIRGDATFFPNLSVDEFNSMRADFLKVIGMRDLSFEHADAFMVFLMIDCLGRAQDDFIEAFERQFNVADQVGLSDYERRTRLILERYHLASYSFARLGADPQTELLGLFKMIYDYNAGQVIQLEAGPLSLYPLRKAKPEMLSKLFYRAFLSFSGIPTNDHRLLAQVMTSDTVRKWRGLEKVTLALADPLASVEQVYLQYVDYLAKNLGIDFNGQADVPIVRLLSMSRATTKEDVEAVQTAFSSLPAQDQQIIREFLSGSKPVLVYDLCNLIAMTTNGTGLADRFGDGRENLTKAYKELASIYRALNASGQFQDRLRRTGNNEIRVLIRPVLEYLTAAEDSEIDLDRTLRVDPVGTDFIVRPK